MLTDILRLTQHTDCVFLRPVKVKFHLQKLQSKDYKKNEENLQTRTFELHDDYIELSTTVFSDTGFFLTKEDNVSTAEKSLLRVTQKLQCGHVFFQNYFEEKHDLILFYRKIHNTLATFFLQVVAPLRLGSKIGQFFTANDHYLKLQQSLAEGNQFRLVISCGQFPNWQERYEYLRNNNMFYTIANGIKHNQQNFKATLTGS